LSGYNVFHVENVITRACKWNEAVIKRKCNVYTGVRIGDELEHATILKKDGVTTDVRTAAGQTGRKCKNQPTRNAGYY
jgi:hypothetical protein